MLPVRAFSPGRIALGCLSAFALLVLLLVARPVSAETIGPVQTVPDARQLGGIACPSSSTCFAVGVNSANTAGILVPITNGIAGAGTSVAGTTNLVAIACPTSAACIAVGDNNVGGGGVPIANGTAGAGQSVAGTTSLAAIACPSIAACLAVGDNLNSDVGTVVPLSVATSSASLSSSPNPSSAGQPVTLTAAVTCAGFTATGTVTFTDGATVLGTGTLNASSVATFTTGSLGVGNHSISASYHGDVNCVAVTSAGADPGRADACHHKSRIVG
jgi:hypothetical protein